MFQLPAPGAPRYNLFINPPHSTAGITKPPPPGRGGFGGGGGQQGWNICNSNNWLNSRYGNVRSDLSGSPTLVSPECSSGKRRDFGREARAPMFREQSGARASKRFHVGSGPSLRRNTLQFLGMGFRGWCCRDAVVVVDYVHICPAVISQWYWVLRSMHSAGIQISGGVFRGNAEIFKFTYPKFKKMRRNQLIREMLLILICIELISITLLAIQPIQPMSIKTCRYKPLCVRHSPSLYIEGLTIKLISFFRLHLYTTYLHKMILFLSMLL